MRVSVIVVLLAVVAYVHAILPTGVALLTPTANCITCRGTATFTALDGGVGVTVSVTLTGMPANTYMGVHIHQFGDLVSLDGSAAGSHFNPYNEHHNCTGPRHVGDLGNILSISNGQATGTFLSDTGSMDINSIAFIVGRMLVVHSQQDDCKTQPTGNAGSRLLTGVIGLQSGSVEPISPPSTTADLTHGIAVLTSTVVGGTIEFTVLSYLTQADIFLVGFVPNANVSLYVLNLGDITPAGSNDVFDPTGAAPTCTGIYGYMGQFTADDQGVLLQTIYLDGGRLSLFPSSFYLPGHSVAVFGPDDCTTFPDGNRGVPLARGVIGVRGSAAWPQPLLQAYLLPYGNGGAALPTGSYATVISSRVWTGVTSSALHRIDIPPYIFDDNVTLSVHIREYGQLTDSSAVGGIFNPTGVAHGCFGTAEAGGLGNVVYSNTSGVVVNIFSRASSVDTTSSGSIIGRAITISTQTDPCDGSFVPSSFVMAGVIGYQLNSPLAYSVASPPLSSLQGICEMTPIGSSSVRGTVIINANGTGVAVYPTLRNFVPSSSHGFHMHAYGDISDSAAGTAAGPHFNPYNGTHGCEPLATRHVGDFGNILANAQGQVATKIVNSLATVSLSGTSSVFGHSLIVHAVADDCITQPSGNAGGRIAQCIIAIARPGNVVVEPTQLPTPSPTHHDSAASSENRVSFLFIAVATAMSVAVMSFM